MFVRCDASILHADLDAFYASVEQRDDPSLRGRPLMIGGGVVLTASYEARPFGVRTAMAEAQARRLCPQAVVVPPRMAAYSRASDAVFEVFRDLTPVVEALSLDEAFLDVPGCAGSSGTPVQIADGLRADVRDRVGLPITSVSPGRGSSPRSPATSPSPTASVGAAGQELGLLRRCRCAVCGEWAQRRPRSCTRTAW